MEGRLDGWNSGMYVKEPEKEINSLHSIELSKFNKQVLLPQVSYF